MSSGPVEQHLCIGSFGFQASEYTLEDAEEDEEDENVEAVEEQDEEEDEANVRDRNRHFGYTNAYDPVVLKVSCYVVPTQQFGCSCNMIVNNFFNLFTSILEKFVLQSTECGFSFFC